MNTFPPNSETDKQKLNLLPVQTITFNNGASATVIKVAPQTDPQRILKTLKSISPQEFETIKAFIVVSGGAGGLKALEQTSQYQLQQLLTQGIVQVADEIRVGFITGGTDSGIMAMLGQTLAECHYALPLIGIAPADLITMPDMTLSSTESKTPLEANHSHFILVAADEWGQETDTMYALAAALLTEKPVLTILINGGEIAQSEVLYSVRLGIAVIVIQGSGRLADKIALYTLHPQLVTDPIIKEIIASGKIHLFPLENDIMAFKCLLHSVLFLK